MTGNPHKGGEEAGVSPDSANDSLTARAGLSLLGQVSYFCKKTNLTGVTINVGTAKYGSVPRTQKKFVRRIWVNEIACIFACVGVEYHLYRLK